MKSYFISILVLIGHIVYAQNDNLSIDDTPFTPTYSSSAQLEIKSLDKGVLIPRMSYAEKTAIINPALGLLVYENDTSAFWFYDGVKWVTMGHYSFSYLQDTDGDTKIMLEKNVDEDIIHFEAGGAEIATLEENDFKLKFDADLLCGNSMTGPGEKMFYRNNQKAFRSGYVDGNQWDEASTGLYSIAFGENNLAFGEGAAAFGENNVVASDYSTTWGLSNSATGLNSLSFGTQTNASGDYSTSWGHATEATGDYATSWGWGASAQGQSSTAFGFSSIATGLDATAWGMTSKASAIGGTAFGDKSEANGDYSTAFGDSNNAESYVETAFGIFCENNTPASSNSWNSSDLLFAVGNGTSDQSRKNAFQIYKNANAVSTGDVVIYKGFNSQGDLVFNEPDGPNFRFYINGVGDHLNLVRTLANGSLALLMNWNELGQLTIGLGSASQDFNVYGNASKSSSGGWLANSDRRLKRNISSISPFFAMNQVLKMKGVSYEWNDDKTGIERPDDKQYGFIAQDLKALWPEKVSKDRNGYYVTAYGEYDPMFVSAFKAQNEQLLKLERDQDNLNAESTSINEEYLMIVERISQLKKELKCQFENEEGLIDESSEKLLSTSTSTKK